ncbi:uncharacterized protein N7506_005713 [Penicillium brevicompactum]|uniref:uncharacterized protein n=1 Tax=Penicillium brevicompactum TaxID=5074 RepID=UPI0025414C57|nr:uncharacterized protein N7506_005713 [Penicillium brevicompactum]KAJ5335777.1 hypothetical protein N7506_005713 [Penicillium brevicompactum]
MAASSSLCHDDYTVGWICALPVEMAAAKLMLDAIHPSLPRPPTDQNNYILRNIGDHNIVIASLPSGAYGNVSAATVAMQLLSSFHSIRFGLMVGIGGGVPSSKADIRLGDIVVIQPADTSGGVIQYDLGKALSGGQFQRTGMLNRPPKVLLATLATLQAHHLTEDSLVLKFISEARAKMTPRIAAHFARPTKEDLLYQTEYEHGVSDTCVDCDRSKLTSRPSREYGEPVIHYGLIASANQVVKDGRRRDQLGRDLGVLCVEMEAAGLMNDFPCLVVRGICDYADSHKNKEWQGYAAMVAAAYAKELVLVVPIDQIQSTLTARDALVDSVRRFNIPLDLNAVPLISNFVGRQGELDNLWQCLQPEVSPSRKVAVLYGLGGMGKTQLADRESLVQSLSVALSRLPGQSSSNEASIDTDVEQQARHMLRWLALDGNSRWLIIFDNVDHDTSFHGADSDDYNIEKFFPNADHGSILITSRLQRLSDLGEPFSVQRLDSESSIELLLQSSGLLTRNTTRNFDRNPGRIAADEIILQIMLTYVDTLSLANRLDGLPLAIVIAGAFMRETGTSITEYLQYYQKSWSELQLQSNPGRQYHQGNILQTWMISYLAIQKRDPSAADLLLLLARFDNRDIWYELVKCARHSSNIPDWLNKATSSGLAFKAGVKSLIGFSLLDSRQQEGSYTMHPVVQDWCHYIANESKDVDQIQLNELAVISVGYSVPSADTRDYSKPQQRLLPHANYVRHLDCLDDSIELWGAFHCLGALYFNQSKLKEAEETYQRALVGYEKTLSLDHTSTLNTVNNLGNLYFVQGKLKEAEEMYQRALVGYEKTLGLDHTSTLNTVNNFGLLYSDQGKLNEAEELYQRVLAGKEKALGSDRTSTLNTVDNFGTLYSDQGKLNEAEEMYQRALAGKEKALGPDHTSTLDTVNNLGILYKAQGKLHEAEEMYQPESPEIWEVANLNHHRGRCAM